MTARPGGYITMSEIEVYAKSPGVSSDAAAASIEVAGVPIARVRPGHDRLPGRHRRPGTGARSRRRRATPTRP